MISTVRSPLAIFALALMVSGCSALFQMERNSDDAGPEPAPDAGVTVDASPNVVPDAYCYRAAEGGCPQVQDGGQLWEFYPGGCSCYIATDDHTPASNSTAQEVCSSMTNGIVAANAHFMAINSFEERLFLQNMNTLKFGGADPNHFVLGLFFIDSQWQWTTGEEVNRSLLPNGLLDGDGASLPCVRYFRDGGPLFQLYDCKSQATAPSTGQSEIICELDGLAGTKFLVE